MRMYRASPRLIEQIAGGSESHSPSIRPAAGSSFRYARRAQLSRTTNAPPLRLVLLQLALLAALLLQLVGAATRSICPDATEGAYVSAARLRVVDHAPDSDILAIRFEGNLVAGLDPDLLANRLWEHNLSFDSDLVR